MAITTLLQDLKRIRDNGPEHEGSGICRNITTSVGQMEFNEIVKLWPSYSGDHVFPVPSGNRRTEAEEAYLYCSGNNLWNKQTSYGQMRWACVEWCINKLENPDG